MIAASSALAQTVETVFRFRWQSNHLAEAKLLMKGID
jgi:hypothetical protein